MLWLGLATPEFQLGIVQ